MAFIQNTAFEARVANGEFNTLENITGLFQTSSENDICSAGFLVKQNGLMPNEGYTGLNNENSYLMTAALNTDLVDTPIFACNTYNVQELTDGSGAVFKVGAGTLGLAVPAGEPATFTHIIFDGMHHYRFGIGNLSTAISSNQYFTIANGLLVPAAAAPTTTGAPYFQLLGTGNFVEGNRNSFTYYDVVAKTVAAVAGAGA